MTFTTWPTRLILEECDNVCICALNAIAPAAQALCRDKAEGSDYLSNITYFCCPDAQPAGHLSDRKNPVAFGADQTSQRDQLLNQEEFILTAHCKI